MELNGWMGADAVTGGGDVVVEGSGTTCVSKPNARPRPRITTLPPSSLLLQTTRTMISARLAIILPSRSFNSVPNSPHNRRSRSPFLPPTLSLSEHDKHIHCTARRQRSPPHVPQTLTTPSAPAVTTPSFPHLTSSIPSDPFTLCDSISASHDRFLMSQNRIERS